MSPVAESEIREIVQRVLKSVQGSNPGAGAASTSQPAAASTGSASSMAAQKTIAVGADHGGFEMKEALKKYLGELGYAVIDCGTNDKTAVDYPDFAYAVAKNVAEGKAWRGIVADGAGIGSCIAA